MRISEALNLTLEHFNITGRELAQRSGVTESALSRFRRGEKDLQASSIEKLFAGLPSEAFHYLMAQLWLSRNRPESSIHMLRVIASNIQTGEVALNPSFPETLLAS
jgi:transcriptional regulator with XRE-family HTH domain